MAANTTIYKAKAAVVKVSVGPVDGNRVARIIRKNGVIPEGVDAEQIKRLEKRKLITKVSVPSTSTSDTKSDDGADNKSAADGNGSGEKTAESK